MEDLYLAAFESGDVSEQQEIIIETDDPDIQVRNASSFIRSSSYPTCYREIYDQNEGTWNLAGPIL